MSNTAYTRQPSAHLSNQISAMSLCDEDWMYLAEAVKAHAVCRQMVDYLTSAAQRGTGISEDVVYYIITGRDQYAFQQEVKKDAAKKAN